MPVRHHIRRYASHAVARGSAVGMKLAPVRNVAGTLVGAAGAGAIDAYMGAQGSANPVAVAALAIGYFFKQPDLINLSGGLGAPAVYRASLAYMSKPAGS